MILNSFRLALAMLAVFFLSVNPGVAGQIKLILDFEAPGIGGDTQYQAPGEDPRSYDKIITQDMYDYGDGPWGTPKIPYKALKILLPQGEMLERVELNPGDATEIWRESPNPILPMEHSTTIHPDFVDSFDPDQYFPMQLNDNRYYTVVKADNYCKGYTILLLKVYPIQYRQSDERLVYHASMELTVTTAAGGGINPLFRKSKKDRAWVRSIVDNPDDTALDSYVTKPLDQPSSPLVTDGMHYDYVIITNDNFKGDFGDFINRKQSLGLNVAVVGVGDIVAPYFFYHYRQEKIRDFITAAYCRWGTDYVLLAADTEDIPARKMPSHEMNNYFDYFDKDNRFEIFKDEIPSDLYYAALDGTWEMSDEEWWGAYSTFTSTNDIDLFSEVLVGRIPFNDREEILNYTGKLNSYLDVVRDRNNDHHQSLLARGDHLWGPADGLSNEYPNLNSAHWGGDYLQKGLQYLEPHFQVTKRYQSEIYSGEFTDSGCILRGYNDYGIKKYFRQSCIRNEIKRDPRIILHGGHGGPWHVFELYPNIFDSSEFDEESFFFLLYSTACKPASFANEGYAADSVGETLVLHPKGALAFIGYSHLSLSEANPDAGGNQDHLIEFSKLMAKRDGMPLGEMVERMRVSTTGYFEDSSTRWNYYGLTLLGDPHFSLVFPCTDPGDADSDDDGIADDDEDQNGNQLVDPGETDPCNPDSDGDGIQDGTEMGLTLDQIGPDTDRALFQPDLNPMTTTNPLDTDSDNDGLADGEEDVNGDGQLDAGETDPSIDDHITIYEDAEDHRSDRWIIVSRRPSDARVSNVYDYDRGSRVIEFTGRAKGFRLQQPPLGDWRNSEEFFLQWSMKYSNPFSVYISVETTAGPRNLVYRPDDETRLGTGRNIYYGLGTSATDGQWHTYQRDLQQDLQRAQPGEALLAVNGFFIRGNGRVDDIRLMSTAYTLRLALIELYNATDGPNWHNNANWGTDADVSTWWGVLPEPDGFRLDLSSNGLSGTLPASLGELIKMHSLNLSGNALTGRIPAELGSLPQLYELLLEDNRLSGPIPDAIGHLDQLWALTLGHNELTGYIPASLTNLTQVNWLSLSYNHLCAQDPDLIQFLDQRAPNWREQGLDTVCHPMRRVLMELYNATDGPNWHNNANWDTDADVSTWWGVQPAPDGFRLDLSSNGLSGTLPTSLGELIKMHSLNLSGNALTGRIPAELGSLPQLYELLLEDNRLSGPIPDAIGHLDQLWALTLGHNELTGDIPASLTNLSQVVWLSLSYNHLCAQDPDLILFLDQRAPNWREQKPDTHCTPITPDNLVIE